MTHIVNVHIEPAETNWHSAILEPRITDMMVGPAVGSQEDRGVVAHLIIDSGTGSQSARHGYTVADPDVLEEMAGALRLLADTLRRERAQ